MPERKLVPRRYRLRALILLLVSVVLLVVIAASVEAGLRRAAHMMEDDLVFSGKLVAEEMATYLRSVETPNEANIERTLLLKLTDAPSVIEITVLTQSPDGDLRVLASSGESPRFGLGQLERLDGTAAILEHGKDRVALLGAKPTPDSELTVLVATTLQRVDQFLSVSRRWAIALSLGGVTFVLLAMNFVFQQRIGKPLARIFAVVTQPEDKGRRIVVDRDDEIGVIAAGVNQLLDRIKARTEQSDRLVEEIHSLNADLQRRIDSATSDLTRKNQALARITADLVGAENRLLQAERLASAGLMAAVLAHEVGSPLASLSAHVEMLLEDPHLGPAQTEPLQVMRKQIERVTVIVDDMLRSARRGPDDFTTLRLDEVLDEVLSLVSPRLEARGIRLERDVPETLLVRGYSVYLQEAFLNLINNATDAVGPDGRITLVARRENGEVWVEVRDNGPGIDPKIVEDLGKHFVTTKSVGQGAGLGLAIVRDIVRRHGGSLSFDSSARGAVVRVTLPAIQTQAATA